MARWIRIGLITGAVCVFVSVIGMVQGFNDRNVLADVVTLGYVLLGVAMALGGYLAARPEGKPGDQAAPVPGSTLARGAGVGLLSGGLLAALVVVDSLVSLRSVFVNVTPVLIHILTFGQGTALGGSSRAWPGRACGCSTPGAGGSS
jgi:branched-chain amino acid transport system permease protein